jgi:hypothetical protein
MTETEKGHLTALFPYGDEDWHELLQPLQHIDVGVFLICVISIIIMLVWDKPFIKNKVKFISGSVGGSNRINCSQRDLYCYK